MIKTIESTKHGNIKIIYREGMDFATISWYSKKGLEIARVPTEMFATISDITERREKMRRSRK